MRSISLNWVDLFKLSLKLFDLYPLTVKQKWLDFLAFSLNCKWWKFKLKLSIFPFNMIPPTLQVLVRKDSFKQKWSPSDKAVRELSGLSNKSRNSNDSRRGRYPLGYRQLAWLAKDRLYKNVCSSQAKRARGYHRAYYDLYQRRTNV